MSDPFENLPDRIEPYITSPSLNEPVLVLPGPFRLVGPSEGRLDADLAFRWLPSTAIAFDGSYSCPHVWLEHQPWSLESDGTEHVSVPVLVTHATLGSESSSVGGVVQRSFSLGHAPFEVLRFSLANFSDYIGAPVRYQRNGNHGFTRVRLQTSADIGLCRVDAISEVSELRERASRDAGFVISHVGEWLPPSGQMTAVEAEETLDMLHFWFGLLRGAWAGPLFEQGLAHGEVVWRQFAHWKVSESREVTTWMPERRPLDLSTLFAGFARRWGTPVWREPLKSAISWFVEANSPRTARETSIVISQVALDLLAWVHLVETQRVHSRTDFKRLSAAGRIRVLLQHVGVPAALPDYLTHLPSLQNGDAFDGPGIITRVRNALVHSTEDNRAVTKLLDGLQLLECSQLALHYVELALLAVCEYSGHYARRGWVGWKGDDETVVPWGEAG